MNKEEYEIIYVPNEGRAVKNNITGKIYYSEFQIIDEKNQQITQLTNNWNELEEWLKELQKFKGINQQGFSWGVAQEVLDKMKEIKGE